MCNADVVVETAKLIRTLILDDDVRVPFGKAHEHAKLIVTEGLAIQKLLDVMRVRTCICTLQ
jgi:hypothetical protein